MTVIIRSSQILSAAVVAVLVAAGGARAQDAAAPAAEAAKAPAAAAATTPAAPDTSAWKCSKCPFPKGHEGDVELGAGYLDESSAKFGDYTGLDEDGVHVEAGAQGRLATESGYTLDYELTDLGLDSRSIAVSAGKQGAYELGLSYDRVPHRIAEGEAIHRGSSNLTLPSNWVTAGSTAGMTALDASLHEVDVGFDRDRYGLFGRFFAGEAWSFDLDYRRDERSGNRNNYQSFGSVANELLRPIDDATDRLDASVRYQRSNWFAELGYYGSIYDTKTAAYSFDNPYTAFVPGGERGRAALEPDNSYHELAVSVGWFGLPLETAVTFTAAMGQGTQDSGFVAYTINPDLTVDALPMSNLDGEMTVTRASLTASARPVDRLRLRGALTYDERDNDSRQAAFTSIVHTDQFLVADDRVNPVYGFERTRAYGTADWRVYDDLDVGVGGEWRNVDRTGTTVEVTGEEVLDGYVRAQFRPTGYLGFVVKGGVEEREPDDYDTDLGLAAFGQNPLMRKFHMGYRYRSYGEFLANVAVMDWPVTLSMSAFYGDDSYNESVLGITSGIDRRVGADLSWAVSEGISAYVSATREKIDSRTSGSSVFGWPDWRTQLQDDYETYGAGVTARLGDKFRVGLDYTYADGQQRRTLDGVAPGSFPAVSSELSSFKADVTYAFSPRADVVLGWWYETLDSEDWAFSSQPAVLPTLLGLGVDPYDYDVNFVTLSVRYRFGGAEPEAAAAGE